VEVDTPECGEASPLLCVPVRFRNKTMGVMRVFLEAGVPASARTGEILAAAISAAVRNALMVRGLLECVDEVAKARRENQARVQDRDPRMGLRDAASETKGFAR